MHTFVGTCFFLCLTLFLLSPLAGYGQVHDGRIEAVVQDGAGTALPGATVSQRTQNGRTGSALIYC